MGDRLRFESYELDPRALELYRGGKPVKLPPQPVKVLSVLARRSGNVVTRDELRRALWDEDTHVDFEGSLHSCIKQIRAALGDDAGAPRFVETLPRRGYRFLAEVRSPDEARRLSGAWLAGALGLAAVLGVSLTAVMSLSGGRDVDASPEAVEALMKGRYHLAKREPESLDAAERYFREATAIEVDFAAAHAGLAEVHLRRALGTGDDRSYEAAVAASERALAIEPTAEAEFVRALGLWYGRWDWRSAGEGLERAISRDPDLARAHHWYAYYLTGLGRHDEAIAEIERARKLEPLSPPIQSDVGWFYYFAGRYGAALTACRRTLELEPGFGLAEDCIVESHLALGSSTRALREASAFAERPFEDLGSLWQSRLESDRGPYDAGLAALRLGDHDEALYRLREAVARRSLWLPVLAVDRRWSAVRERPELADLVRAIGLRPASGQPVEPEEEVLDR